ncbi:UDP-N-acetylmuramate dehydrogenase [Prevotella merdae]|uniref:UDP-N-acetylmuramate dehydrogenase n=1 Tax=Prevotella merdae TaxID=2079531 RepID=UPI003F81052C
MKDILNCSLLAHNTFGIDARCSRFLEYASVEEAQQVALLLRDEGLPYIIVGEGSNLLLTKDYDGIVAHSAILSCKEVSVDGANADEVYVSYGSGVTWDDVVADSVSNGWHGAENLSLIPGEVGASAIQNIGAYGAEAKDLIYKVEAVEIATGKVVEFGVDECAYSYRQSRFKHEWKNKYLITHVTYRFSRHYSPDLDYGNIRQALAAKGIEGMPSPELLRQTIIEIRQAKLPDPKVMGNAGSFFMNPIVGRDVYERLAAQYEAMPHYVVDADHIKIPAGWMIEQCGWKGKSLGRAGVHDRQALVLVNRGGATGNEVVALYEQIIKDVKKKFGIEIHPEVNVI